ncbi:aspartate aminotransferase family protein [Vitiosangium sp. GDMCC 1.1324]|uniref:aspartate aminotransferase family protein n=1 Tax=Vitiosangium sp. (strain GDMCC 1.1324) TaxID=2138576 RepID=UPI000D35BD8F|nr:aminotransferase class III-fold pyridoxal phosphate-dependent enzyme [Vitiosangium sp. GDMCC 1.1324]PTL76224.1 hypothetical protein DAT35_50155 [Vitiosangium sp. GDMCC 1.1324]
MQAESSQEVLHRYRRHAPPALLVDLVDEVVMSAEGATLHCAGDRLLLDFASGGFGYGHPRVREAVAAQIEKAPLSSRILISRPLAMLVQRLAEMAPGELQVSYVCNSGEEALDSSLKLTKGYAPHRRNLVVVEGCDFGTLSHGLYLAGIGESYLRHLPFVPVRVPFGDLQAMLHAVDDSTAAVLLEPVSLARGVQLTPAEYLRALRQRCDETGTLMIINEIQTALGRTGREFAVEHSGVVPDVLVLGGALGGGIIPVGAYVTRVPINSAVYDRRNPTLHGSTTGANPASCAAALAVLETLVEERLAERHAQHGRTLTLALEGLRARHPERIRQVQVLGSLAALEFESTERAEAVRRSALERGLLLRHAADGWLHMRPPLLVSATELGGALDILTASLEME